MSVLVVGSVNMDLILRVHELPVPGQTILARDFSNLPGGKGANQAVAIGRLNGSAQLLANVGQDAYGAALLQSLAEAGVDTRLVGSAPGPSGCAMILVSDKAENMIAVVPGANQTLTPEQVIAACGSHTGFRLTQLEVPIEAIMAAAPFGNLILNPAPARVLPDELLRGLFAITPNETETEALTGIAPRDGEACHAASAKLHNAGVCHVVITLGARGCWYSGPQGAFHSPAFGVECVDTTAAGDAFNGALALALDEGLSWEGALRFANATGALATTRLGAQTSMPSRQEVHHMIRHHAYSS